MGIKRFFATFRMTAYFLYRDDLNNLDTTLIMNNNILHLYQTVKPLP